MFNPNRPAAFLIITITIIFFCLSVYKSWYYTKQYPGTDLLCRTIGSRQVMSDHSPYFYKWNNADDKFFQNPLSTFADGRKVNGNVATPATLVLLNPLSVLSYHIVRPVWTIIQFALLLASILLLTIAQKIKFQNAAFPIILIVLAFVCSNNWHLNILAGQIYIFYSFLWTLIYCLYKKDKKQWKFFAGIIAGISILFRPLMIVSGLIFLLKKDWKTFGAMFIGFGAGILIFLLPVRTSHYADYFKAMNEYSNETYNHSSINISPVADTLSFEGVQHIGSYHQFNTGALNNIQQYAYDWLQLELNPLIFPELFAGLCVLLIALLYNRKKNILSTDEWFLLAFFLYISAELLLVGIRSGYNFIQWIFPVYIIAYRYKTNTRIMILLLLALFLQHGEPFFFPFQFELSEILLLGVTLYIVNRRQDLQQVPELD